MILGIYGAGGLGKGICNLVTQHLSGWDEVVFVDDVCEEPEVYGLRVMPYDAFRSAYAPNEAQLVIAQGEPANKNLLFEKVKADGYTCATLVHPLADISPDCQLGEGVVAFMGIYVSAESVIEDNVCLMAHVGIGHNVRVGKGSQISMGCNIGGYATIGRAVYLGLGATVRDRTSVGDESVISQGACVLQDVREGVVAMGNPARPIAKNKNRRVWE